MGGDLTRVSQPDVPDVRHLPLLTDARPLEAGHDTLARCSAFVLISPRAAHTLDAWSPPAMWMLCWQISWLRSYGIGVTVVTDDTTMPSVLAPAESSMPGHGSLTFAPWQSLSSGMASHLAGLKPDVPVLLMPSPFLTDCNLKAVLATHISTGQAVRCVRQRGRQALPMLYVFQAAHLFACWRDLDAALPAFATHSAGDLPCRSGGHEWTAHFGVLRNDTAAEARRLEAFIGRYLGPFVASRSRTRGVGALAFLSPNAQISPSATLHGPVLISDQARIGDAARVGAWVVLAAHSVVGSGAWIEQAIVGTGAEIEPKGCVYRSVVNAHACVRSTIPVLKARLYAEEDVPRLLPIADAAVRYPHGYLLGKRVLDLALGLLLLIGLSPVLLTVALLCVCTQGWPVIFRHERLAPRDQRIYVLKFRSMRRDADSYASGLVDSTPGFKMADDPRVTRLGRFLRKMSLDELPQLLNVIIGQMSLVGPRPIVAREVIRYGIYAPDLLRVTPGITGYWQVNGRSSTTYAQRVLLDVKYGDICSLRVDLCIILRTVPAILWQRGVA